MNDGTLWELFEREAALPYRGTSGWSGSDTSRERAEKADTDGTTSKRQTETVDLLNASAYRGMTWRDLSDATGWHHGPASGVLSVLHKSGVIARLTERRDRCAVYVMPEFVRGRETAPHRPNASRVLLGELLDELEWLLATNRYTEARSLVRATRETL